MLIRSFLALTTAVVLSLPATDSFDRSAATLGANWTGISGAVTDWNLTNVDPVPHGATPTFSGSDFAAGAWNADSFTSDHYSQAKIVAGPNGYQGVGVRLTAGYSGYFVTLEAGTGCKIYKWVATVRTDITSSGSCSVTWTDGHTLYMQATGANPTSIVVKDNGSVIGTASDSDIDSGGAPGIIGYTNGSSVRLYDWQGDNVGGGGSTFPGAIINAPIRCCSSGRPR